MQKKSHNYTPENQTNALDEKPGNPRDDCYCNHEPRVCKAFLCPTWARATDRASVVKKNGGPENRPAIRGDYLVTENYGLTLSAGPITGGAPVSDVTAATGLQPLPSHAASKSTE